MRPARPRPGSASECRRVRRRRRARSDRDRRRGRRSRPPGRPIGPPWRRGRHGDRLAHRGSGLLELSDELRGRRSVRYEATRLFALPPHHQVGHEGVVRRGEEALRQVVAVEAPDAERRLRDEQPAGRIEGKAVRSDAAGELDGDADLRRRGRRRRARARPRCPASSRHRGRAGCIERRCRSGSGRCRARSRRRRIGAMRMTRPRGSCSPVWPWSVT